MKIAATCVAVAAAATAFAPFAHAQDEVAYWSFNNQALPGGGFGYLAGSFPFAAEFGDQAGTATLNVSGGITDEISTTSGGDDVFRWIQSFGGTDIGAEFGEGSGGSLAVQGGTDTLNNGSQITVSFDGTGLDDLELYFAARRTSTGFGSVTIELFDGDTLVTEIASAFDVGPDFALQFFAIDDLDGVEDARVVVTLDGATSSNGNIRTDNWLIEGDPATGGCRADIDGDGELTIFDFLEFQNLFDAGDLAADFDGDGSLTLFDFLEFQNEFDAGC